jgi:hypothetical protein
LASRAKGILSRVGAKTSAGKQLAPLVRAMESGDAAKIKRAAAALQRKAQLTRVGGETGQQVAFDRATMASIGGDIADGAQVRIIRPGFTADVSGESVLIDRAAVQALSRQELQEIERRATAGLTDWQRRAAAIERDHGAVVKTEKLGGALGQTERVTFADGTTAIRKSYAAAHRSAADIRAMTDGEQLGAAVVDAVGVRAPAVVVRSDLRIDMEDLSGRLLGEAGDRIPAEILESTDGRLMGVADYLMANTDRTAGNVLIQGDRLAGIDHGYAFSFGPRNTGTGLLVQGGSDFVRFLADRGGLRAVVDVNPADLAKIRTRLEALRPMFEAEGRGDWHKLVMRRLAALEKRASPAAPIRLTAGMTRQEIQEIERKAAMLTGRDVQRATRITRLTESQRAAVDRYGGDGSYVINADLREHGGRLDLLTVRNRQTVETLDTVFARSELQQEAILYRRTPALGGPFGDLVNADRNLVGFTWTEDAYSSTSIAERTTGGSRVQIRIFAPRGTRAISHATLDSDEVLLDRGTTFRVIADHGKDSRFNRVIDVEIVPKPALTPTQIQRAAARERNRIVEQAQSTAKLLMTLDEQIARGASKAVLRQTLDPALIEAGQVYAGVDPATLKLLRDAVDGDPVKLRAALTRAGTKTKLKPIGKAGQKVKFDPATMEVVEGTGTIPAGAQVEIVRRGATFEGLSDPLAKAQVRLVGPTRDEAIAKAQAAIAKAGPNGPTAARLKSAGITRVGSTTDSPVIFDPVVHEGRSGITVPRGAKVRVVEPGYSIEYQGETVIVQRPVVRVTEWPDRGDFPNRDAMKLTDIAADLHAATASGRWGEAVRKAETEAFDRVSVAMNSTYGGLRTHVDSVRTFLDQMQVRGTVYQGQRQVGTFTRELSLKDNIVEHAYLQIDRSVQGSGFAERFNGNLFEWYRRSGIRAVKVHADIDVGGYTWATQGFDFETAARARDFIDWAQRKIATQGGITPTGMTQAQFVELTRYIDEIKKGQRAASAPEIARFGRKPRQGGKTSVWPGKWLMLGSNWYGILPL